MCTESKNRILTRDPIVASAVARGSILDLARSLLYPRGCARTTCAEAIADSRVVARPRHHSRGRGHLFLVHHAADRRIATAPVGPCRSESERLSPTPPNPE